MSQKISGVKGMNDVLPGGEVEAWQFVERTARELFQRYGYGELRTPAVEDTALFIRSVGEDTDIVGKEMYTFEDKGGRSLSLRPEGTAPAVRAFIEHAVSNQEPVTRWFYLGPMFRYERMKTGRYRQFSQLGCEAYGSRDPAQDVEVLDFLWQFLGALGLSGVRLHLNTLGDDACRPAWQASLVAHLRGQQGTLCADCQRRLETNPLRVLDCKSEQCQSVARAAPDIHGALCNGCRAHFEDVKRLLGALSIPFEVDPRLVRGLDYYTRTTFEFIASDPVLGTASTVAGGGRYDKLVKSLGGPDTPAVGFGLGLERLVLLLRATGRQFTAPPELFVAWMDDASRTEALVRISALRRAGFRVEFDPRGGSLKSQMKRADKVGARFALVLGDAELKSGEAQLKQMAGGEPVPVKLAGLGEFLSAARATT
ncbi:MAG: histidine--tRNA ligase [Deltaproteobacteria bacterium]|nr:histidine--tRNA ligase [Deltaproteobacteria bacterium]